VTPIVQDFEAPSKRINKLEKLLACGLRKYTLITRAAVNNTGRQRFS
jgi:hypothetical protein